MDEIFWILADHVTSPSSSRLDHLCRTAVIADDSILSLTLTLNALRAHTRFLPTFHYLAYYQVDYYYY